MAGDNHVYTLDQIDDNWTAVHLATLLFVIDGEKILLIRKKRGLGAGKINGPGGKLDPGETLQQCAVREVQEEVGVTPINPVAVGELRFQFTDGYSIHVHVFTALAHIGTTIETDEAVPLWIDKTAIPYDEMWADDKIWLPRVLDGESVWGRFIFREDEILEHEVNFISLPSVAN